MDNRYVQQFKKGSLEMILLCLIGRKETYGYEIITELNNSAASVLGYAREGTIYPILYRLQEAGLVQCRLAPAIANGGSLAEPTLLLGERGGKASLLKPETAEKIAEMMSYNVAYAYGAGTFPGLAMCAKSGTAETGNGASHAWFTGFLDDAEHPYAFVVVIENGGGGLRNAGPVANAVLQAAVKKDYSGDKND